MNHKLNKRFFAKKRNKKKLVPWSWDIFSHLLASTQFIIIQPMDYKTVINDNCAKSDGFCVFVYGFCNTLKRNPWARKKFVEEFRFFSIVNMLWSREKLSLKSSGFYIKTRKQTPSAIDKLDFSVNQKKQFMIFYNKEN